MSVFTQRPSPGRRRTGMMGARMNVFPLLLVLLSIIAHASAYNMEFNELAQRGQIHIDTSSPPPRPQAPLGKRQDAISTDSSETTDTTPTPTPTPTSTSTSSSSPSPVVITTPIPSPFDTSLGSNFTSQSCPDFFATFLANNTFKACIPVSLLLQNSNSFFRAERSPNLLSETLSAACNAPLPLCVPVMADLASQLISPHNCKDDYDKQNPLVRQAYNGLRAYEPVYRATCLQSTSPNNTVDYCFAQAISNRSNPSDAYPYYTALGLPLPATSQPTCSQCLKQTMAIFSGYAADSTSPLAQTYMGCATAVNGGCGMAFANTTVKVAKTSGAGRSRGGDWAVLVVISSWSVAASMLL